MSDGHMDEHMIENQEDNATSENGTDNHQVSVYQKGDIRHILQPDADRHPDMGGFDAEFKDIVDYIIKITHRIWEEKAVGLIYTYYLHNAVIHTSSGDIYGRDAVVAGTLQTLAAFPDRRLYGDEVIWKHDENQQAFYSSHRITHEGYNTGHTAYGKPTGRHIRYRAVADCIVKDNQVIEEWLVRDEVLLIQQLGFDPHALARAFAHKEAATQPTPPLLGEIERTQGQFPPMLLEPLPTDAAQFDIEAFIRHSWHEIWNWRMLNKVNAYYDENITCESASGRRIYSLGSYKAYVLSLMSPFPDLKIQVDHFCAIGDDHQGYRAATRWTLQGTHTGPGIYGEPTGHRITIIGVTHQLVQNGRITREWTLFDEFALLKQLYAPT